MFGCVDGDGDGDGDGTVMGLVWLVACCLRESRLLWIPFLYA